MRNRQVIERWLHGRRGRSGNGILRTDGHKLFSYKVLIGEEVEGKRVVYDFRGPHKIGLTVTRHVCAAIKLGQDDVEVRTPPPHVDIDKYRKLVQPKVPK